MDGLKQGVEYGVIGVLLMLGLLSLAVAIERWRFYRRVDL